MNSILRSAFVLTAIAVAAVTTGQSASAQGATRPQVSPYLNMLRQGNAPYLNYYGLVRPELQAQKDLNGLQQQFNGLNQEVNTLNAYATGTAANAGGVVTTGNTIGFMTHRRFFMTTTGGGGGGMGGAPGGGGGGGGRSGGRR